MGTPNNESCFIMSKCFNKIINLYQTGSDFQKRKASTSDTCTLKGKVI